VRPSTDWAAEASAAGGGFNHVELVGGDASHAANDSPVEVMMVVSTIELERFIGNASSPAASRGHAGGVQHADRQ
jgi:hypothetical protein